MINYAFPNIKGYDIEGEVFRLSDPDVPYLSVKQAKNIRQRLSTLVKLKLIRGSMDGYSADEEYIADMICENINCLHTFSQVNSVIVCIETGECLIQGI